MTFADILNKIDGIVWGIPIIILLVGTGIYLTCGLGFMQVTRFGFWWKNTIGKVFEKKEAGEGAVTPFQALCTALAATIGTGNISGVAGAIAIGGPGAVFWMWISAFFGMITKYCEVFLAVRFRERNAHGDWVGGPMYYIKNGLGKSWTWLAYVFAAFAGLAAFGIGNCTQVDAITSAVAEVIQVLTVKELNINMIKLICGIIVAGLAAFCLIGGIKRLGETLEKIVPFMAVVYVLAGIVVLIGHLGNIGGVFKAIFVCAFNPKALLGGSVGITVKLAMTKGIGRGLFSNEAGLGSAPIAHAATSNEDPVEQGLFGIFEVFADTIVVCTFTALIILCGNGWGNIAYGQSGDFHLTITGAGSILGVKLATIIVGVCLALFALSTALSWALYGSRCAEFIFGEKAALPYRAVFCIFIICGSFMGLDTAWTLASILNALMAVPNLVALIPLSPIIFKETKAYLASHK